MPTLRIFVASPGDVKPEREAARRVVERLTKHHRGQVEIEGFFWEDHTFDANKTFQEQIPRPSHYDIVVIVLWSRIGTPIRVDGVDYQSATEFEYIDSVRAGATKLLPLLVYRKTSAVPLDIHSKPEALLSAQKQYQCVEQFFDAHFASRPDGIGGHMPFESLADFEERLEEDLRRVVQEVRDRRPEFNLSGSGTGRVTSPYRGLLLFDEEDQDVFFGRTRAVYQVMRALQRQAARGRPFIVIDGRSGVGKSSFVRAGLVPRITSTNVPQGLTTWRKALFEPSDSTSDLIGGLAAAITAEGALPELLEELGSVGAVADLLRSDRPLNAVLEPALARAASAAATVTARLLLVIDPLEEIFTHTARDNTAGADESAREARLEHERHALAAALSRLTATKLLWTVATLRSDFYEQVSRLPALRELKEGDGQFHLAPLSAMEIASAVLLPAAVVGVKFQESDEKGKLHERLIDEALSHSDPMPLLSYTLQELFEKSDAAHSGIMTFDAFEKLGGVQGALTRRADDAYNLASDRTAHIASAWNAVCGLLVDVDEDGRRVRRYARSDQFTSPGARELREELDQARLLITDKDDQGRAVVSIAHEALLRQWPRLRAWIDERAEQLRLRSELLADAKRFLDQRSEDRLVLQGARLARARQFIQTETGMDVPGEVREYVRANLEKQERSEHQRRRRNRVFTAVLCCLTLVMAGVAAVAYRMSQVADGAKLDALKQQQAAESQGRSSLRHSTQSQAIVLFLLQDIGSKLDSKDAKTSPLRSSIKQRVTDAAQLIDTSDDSPQVRGQVASNLMGMAKAVAALGGNAEAAIIQKKGIETYEATGSTDSDRLSDAYLDLNKYYFNSSQYTLARKATAKSDSVRNVMPGQKAKKDFESATSQYKLLKPLGHYTEAAKSWRDHIAQMREGSSERRNELRPLLAEALDQHSDITRNLGSFAVGQAQKDLYEESERAAEESLAIYTELRDSDPKAYNTKLISARSEYASLLAKTGRPGRAREELEKCLSDVRVDSEDWLRPTVQYKLARVLIELKEIELADEVITPSFAFYMNDKNLARQAKCLEVLAAVRLRQGRLEEALGLAKQVLAARSETKLAPFNPDFAVAHHLLAEIHEARKDSAAAAAARHEEEQVLAEFKSNEALAAAKDAGGQ